MNAAWQIVVYLLCFLASVLCALLLLRGYQRSRARLLLWSGAGALGAAVPRRTRERRPG